MTLHLEQESENRRIDFFDLGAGVGPYTENGTQYPSLVYSEVSTILTIDASGIAGAVSE